MKILVVENVWMGKAKYKLFDKFLLTAFSLLPTLYARQLVAITPKKHQVKIINERYEKINFNKKYDIVNINYTTSTAPRAYEIAKIFKEKGSIIVLSGLHASAIPEEAIKHADSVLLGRGEMNWLKFLEDYEKNKIKSIYESIPHNKEIYIPPTNINLPGFVMTGAIEATRGCPYKCDFCPESNIPGGTNFYARPINEVISEIKSIPYKTIQFYDTSLTIKPEYTKKLFKEMKGLKKRFFCNGNPDVLAQDEELVKLSKEAGCVAWLVGFESVNQKTIDLVGKKTNKVEEYYTAIENIHNNKMAVIGDFIFGFDTDTKDVFINTLKIIKDLKIDSADFCILTPFPGTPLYEQLEKEDRLLTKDWSEYNLKNVVFKPKNMTLEELKEGIKKVYIEYYSSRYSIKRIIRGLKLGIYPFFMILARNAVANMNSRRFFQNDKKY